MQELSHFTITILAISKIIMFSYLGLTLFLIFQKNKPLVHLFALTAAVGGFYLLLCYKLQRMWWANNGDEMLIIAFFSRVLNGQYLADFYYSWLPPFYPPLYFWFTGTIASFIAQNAISAAKIGVFLTLSIWFIGSYLWQKFYWRYFDRPPREKIFLKNSWFHLILPLIYFLTLDFDTIITKPYETLSALFCVLFSGLLAESLSWDKWNYKNYLFIGVSAGILFLTYYFWWFILIPVMFVLALLTKNRLRNLRRIIIVGLVMLAVSAIYLVPLLLTYSKYGMENWQAVFFVPFDFTTFLPWTDFSLKTIFIISGLAGLIIFSFENKFILANLLVLIFCYLYQLVNILVYLTGLKPAQSSKPFLFLGTAAICCGTAYLLFFLYEKYLSYKPLLIQKTYAIVAIIIFFPLLPFAKFIDDPAVQMQIEKDLTIPQIAYLIPIIKEKIPDFKNRIWFSSGSPELNAYLPLNYYLAHNIHFSHPAILYSQRMAQIKKMSIAQNSEEFMRIINQLQPQINALILNYSNTDFYPLYFRQDNYPNGGKELIIDLPKSLISEKDWDLKYQDKFWLIYTKK